jgi:hypothetical protein
LNSGFVLSFGRFGGGRLFEAGKREEAAPHEVETQFHGIK